MLLSGGAPKRRLVGLPPLKWSKRALPRCSVPAQLAAAAALLALLFLLAALQRGGLLQSGAAGLRWTPAQLWK